MDKQTGYALVRNAREAIADVNSRISDKTAAQYAAAFDRMTRVCLPPEKMANTVRGFYYYRAAFIHHHAGAIREHLALADTANKQGDAVTWQNHLQKVGEHLQKLKEHRPDPKGEHLAQGVISKWAVEAEKRERAGEKIERHSKRERLRGLAPEWREKMFSALDNSKYQDAVAVLSCTGARPAELEKGVKISLTETGHLRFAIEGAKTHDGKYGQALRVLEIAVRSREAQHLADQVRQQGEMVVYANAGRLSDRVRHLSAAVFPKLRKPISAYVFRHQMAADLKASGMSETDVSTALGHSSDESKGYYGGAQSGRGICAVLTVNGSRPVRQITQEKIRALEQARGQEQERER